MSDNKKTGEAGARTPSSQPDQKAAAASQKTDGTPRTPASPGSGPARGRSRSPVRGTPASSQAAARGDLGAGARMIRAAPAAAPSSDSGAHRPVPPTPTSEMRDRRPAGARGAARHDVRGMPSPADRADRSDGGAPATPLTPQSQPTGAGAGASAAAAAAPRRDEKQSDSVRSDGTDERIWLTNVLIRDVRRDITAFFKNFRDDSAAAAVAAAGAAGADEKKDEKKNAKSKSKAKSPAGKKGKKGKKGAAAAADGDAMSDAAPSDAPSDASAPGAGAALKPAKYIAMMQECHQQQKTSLNLNARDVYQYNRKLYSHLATYPSVVIGLFDAVLGDLRAEYAIRRLREEKDITADERVQMELDLDFELKTLRIQVRPFGLLETKNMRDLNPIDIDALISIKGMVIRVGAVTPDMVKGFFECSTCLNSVEVAILNGRINEPLNCDNCKQRHTMTLQHNRCKFSDRQLVKIQEQPDTIPEGETPHTVKVYAFDDLVDVPKPGDRVEITGVYRAVSSRLNPRKRTVKTVFKTYIDAVHIKKAEKGRLGAEDAHADKTSEFFTNFDESDTPEEVRKAQVEEYKALTKRPHFYTLLARSLAPSIFQMEDVKKGILCQLFGGANLDTGASHGRFRGELNILLCGDPGTSKSQLLQYVHKIAPRGIYTSGKGTSAVGLTASVVRDVDSRELVLESGALVLSDRGVCCIDEFDKMNDATRSILHEVMEQQTVSIAKAGIVCTLNARTSILASANPQDSRYNPKKSVVQNLQLPPTLLSRFDLIYLILDQPNQESDRRLARHLVGLYYENPTRANADKEIIPMSLLTRFISYARANVKPQLSDEASEELVQEYVHMRAVGYNNKTNKVITATPRQLEALIRLSEALARMRLESEVTRDDVTEAIRLMRHATQTAATDANGLIDMDLIFTGRSSSERKTTDLQINAMKEIITANAESKKLTVPLLMNLFNQNSQIPLTRDQVDDLLRTMGEQKIIKKKGDNVQLL